MRYIFSIITFFTVASLQAQEYRDPSPTDPGYLGESNRFMFFESYWLNAHHWIYNMSVYAQEKPIEEVIGAPYEQFSDREKVVLAEAIAAYQSSVLEHDLLFGEMTYSFKRWVVTQSNDQLLWKNPDFEPIISQLNALKPLYDRHFWKKHQNQNRQVYDDNIEIVQMLEDTSIVDLEAMTRAEWQETKIRVDICFHSKLERPYTSVTPVTHIVMDSKKNHSPVGNWFELLLHEACHHLIDSNSGFVGGTILDVAAGGNYRMPRQLWHGYLFYFSGRVAQRHLNSIDDEYELYMIRRGVFERQHRLLRKYLDPYIGGEISLHDATRSLMEEYWKSE